MSLKLHYPLLGNTNQQGIVAQTVTLLNGGPASSSGGPFSNCMSFTSTQGVKGAGDYGLSGSSGCTVACWLNLTDTGKYIWSIEKGTYWQLSWSGTTLSVRDNAVGWTGSRKDLTMTAPPVNLDALCVSL